MIVGIIIGLVVAIGVRALLPQLMLLKLNSDIRILNGGDYGPLLKGFADDAVLRFNEADHRWSGDYVGKPRIEEFLREFTHAGLQGEIKALWIAGPPWALTMCARFDDFADDAHGNRIYANKTVLWVRTRWGKIVEQQDFYEDTGRILAFDKKLTELGVEPLAAAV